MDAAPLEVDRIESQADSSKIGSWIPLLFLSFLSRRSGSKRNETDPDNDVDRETKGWRWGGGGVGGGGADPGVLILCYWATPQEGPTSAMLLES